MTRVGSQRHRKKSQSCFRINGFNGKQRVQFNFRSLLHCVEYFVTVENVRVNGAADVLYSCRLHAHKGDPAWRIKRSCRETRGVSDLK